jgi:hypothetical protein
MTVGDAPPISACHADAYSYTAGLSRRDWAWEFLRRNAAFGAALKHFSLHVTVRRVTPNLTSYRVRRGAPSLADWGMIFRDLCR